MELVILIGLQASGKSTFRRARFEHTHVHVSKDLLRNNRRPGRRQRQLIEQALMRGESVVVDNTNPRVADRAELVQLARDHGAGVVAYLLCSRVDEALERNRRREGRERVPDVGLFATAKAFEPPRLDEGFDRLFNVHHGPALDFVVVEIGKDQT